MITSSGKSFISLLNCQKTSALRDQSAAFSASWPLWCQDVRSMLEGTRRPRRRIAPPAHPCPSALAHAGGYSLGLQKAACWAEHLMSTCN